MRDGDVVQVFGIRGELENRITISGNVSKPGIYQLRSGMKVRDLILEADSLLEDTFPERGTIVRTLPDLKKEVLSFNLAKAIVGDVEANLELNRLDEVTIYKDVFFKPKHTVTIAGAVRSPGSFPRYENLKVGDLIVLAGGVTENAELAQVKVSRMDTLTETKYSVVFDQILPSEYWKTNPGDGFVLEDFDHVEVLSNPRYTPQQFITITGQARYPGMYAVRYEGETLDEIMKRAGGFKETAFIDGARFYRSVGGGKVQVPVNLKKALSELSSLDNLKVFGGDSLDIPVNKNVVVVTGEVYVPSGVLYKKGASLSYYLKQAGGPTQYAAEGDAVVTQPNGSKWEPGWFIFPDPEILPGSVVVVPKKKEEKTETLQIIRDWALILANTAAITIAIVQVTK
jgi:protein involved in polysaccharide export with SLBB domain